MERQLQSKILELRDKEVVTIEMQQLCAKMEQQLVQQVDIRITSRCTLKATFIELFHWHSCSILPQIIIILKHSIYKVITNNLIHIISLIQKDQLLRQWAKNKGKPVR